MKLSLDKYQNANWFEKTSGGCFLSDVHFAIAFHNPVTLSFNYYSAHCQCCMEIDDLKGI